MKKIFHIASFSILLSLLNIFPIPRALAPPIPDTGQTKCYNNLEEIPCPQPGEPFYGQDGNYTINPPSYTKLDGNGNYLPDDAAEWVMVRDNVTGLMWENKTNDGSIHDGSKVFTWCDRNAGNVYYIGVCGTGAGDTATDTEAYIKALNDAKFGGFSDWRLPTAKELVRIADHSRLNPAINDAWFPNAGTSGTWTSNTGFSYTAGAWCVHLNGGVASSDKSYPHAVRAVRDGK
jgi:hypothetical protein